MTATQGDLAALSRYIFRAPQWYASVAFALLIAAVTGVAAFDSRFLLEDAWQGVFFVGIPTLAASVLTPWVDRRLDGQLTPNRASLLALFCELVTVALLTVAAVVVVLSGPLPMLPTLGQGFVFDVLLVALASVFAIRLFVVMAVSGHRLRWAVLPASIQTLAGALLLFVYSGTMTYLEIGGPLARSYLSRPEQAPEALSAFVPGDFVVLAVICALYAASTWLFLVVIDQPWKRSLGVSVLEFIRGFIGHIAEGTRELEDFFEQLGEEALVPVTVLSFRRTTEDGSPGGEKARFVLPMIHPGPMGEIGGGNLPQRVAASTEGLGFPPHATAGHDFNLVTEREVDTIIDAADRAADRIEYAERVTESHHVANGEAGILAQAFGDDALLVASYAPNYADDVDYAVGLSAAAEARAGGLREAMVVDAHNSNDGLSGPDLGHVTPGSQRSFDMLGAARSVGIDLGDAPRQRLRLGVAWDRTDWTPMEGVGPLGVRVAVVEAGRQRTAYVLVDGNNMEPGLRGQLVDAVTRHVDAAEVMTTDTHIVNTVEADNQVGAAIDHGDLEALVVDLVGRATDDLEPVVAGMASEQARVTVFGNDRTETLASHANAMISMGGALAAAFVIGVTAVSVLVFFLA
jgi:putative membrane protein